jgi:hypothetical protein
MKAICNLAVWCVSAQALPLQRVTDMSSLIASVAHALDSSFGSSTIEHEALMALSRLIPQVLHLFLLSMIHFLTFSQVPEDMMKDVLVWAPAVYPHLMGWKIN